ncbi:bromodomain-containing protein DDB_G0278469 [Morus notabilis]|uniref:bromodomain-containing protein DDB_G0278469 n=1 Tax=Morus notabilis TaxID=981085 RepID=UPI000CED358E|nr:bromodomain-containing protein DDB_G0278469 [Morus notabilis]
MVFPTPSEEREENMENKEEEEEEEDDRREAAIALKTSLRPDFKPKSNAISQAQFSKFQELNRRRLEIKSKSNFKKKQKGDLTKSQRKNPNTNDVEHKDTSSQSSDKHNNKDSSLLQQESITTYSAPMPRQKLHWGLDTKERWERKANM